MVAYNVITSLINADKHMAFFSLVSNSSRLPSYTSVLSRIPSYTSVLSRIPSYTCVLSRIPSYTSEHHLFGWLYVDTFFATLCMNHFYWYDVVFFFLIFFCYNLYDKLMIGKGGRVRPHPLCPVCRQARPRDHNASLTCWLADGLIESNPWLLYIACVKNDVVCLSSHVESGEVTQPTFFS